MQIQLFALLLINSLLTLNIGHGCETKLPLLTVDNFEYEGAFTLSSDAYASSSLNRADAKIAYNAARNSLFIVGNTKQQNVAEFSIPLLPKAATKTLIHSDAKPLQTFIPILDSPQLNHSQNIDRITGMAVINNKLFINALKYYDARAKNDHTSIVIDKSDALDRANIKGFYSLQGAAHAAGWVSTIPEHWQGQLKGKYLSGNASNLPIASRHSIGPSAFVIHDIDFLDKAPSLIQTTALIDFNLKHRLNPDFYNESGKNNIWNVVSKAEYGFIIPNTKTYAVFGSSGGHHSNLGYKIKQKDGRQCPGPCAYDPNDYYNHYWLFNVDDMVLALEGKKLPHQIRPYEYGKFKVPFDRRIKPNKKQVFNPITGGAYDHRSSTLYLALKNAHQTNQFKISPIIVAYKVSLK